MFLPNARPIFIAEIEQFGGAERSLLALARWLHEQGLPHYLLTYFDHCNIRQYAKTPLTVVSLKPNRGIFGKVTSLRNHFRLRDPNAPPPLCSGYQPALHVTLAGLRGFHDLMHDTPSLFGDETTRSFSSKIRIQVSNFLIGRGLRSGGKTIVTSEYLRGECKKDFGVEAHIVRMGGLSYPAGMVFTQPALSSSQANIFKMLSVCRIEPNKRIDWLLRALACLELSAVPLMGKPLSQIVDWHLELIGKGSLIPELTELSISLGIASRVHFRGFVADEELEGLYQDADLFLMPAVQGYGIPAIEALRRRIPVLLHRESGVSDILLNTPWAFILNGGESEVLPTLARAIRSVVDHHHDAFDPPSLPAENEWAQQVAELCHWT